MSSRLFTPPVYACLFILFAAIYVNRDGGSDFDATSLMQHKITVETTEKSARLNTTAASREEEAAQACGDVLKNRVSFASTSEAHHHKGWRSIFNNPALYDHPFPSWGWHEVKLKPTIICCIVLFIGAVLCSAGGIGGGGIYVTVLMVAGQLTPHDAVPLSKAVVFFGSLSSLFLNIKKTLAMQEGGQKATLIDYNVCRLVVPCSLLGTLIGVMVNSMIASWLIVAMLAGILIGMTYMSFMKFTQQYMEESMDEDDENDNPQCPVKRKSTRAAQAELEAEREQGHIRGILLNGEGWGAFFLLLFTIMCGVFRQHSMNCRGLLSDGMGPSMDACTRPVMSIFLGGNLCTWMSDATLKEVLPIAALVIPAGICLAIASSYSATLMQSEGWTAKEVCGYGTMALFTGCFAGLVGIGGGLVFSPFMLWMGLAPSVAVATSSTCVIFTSSSTTMQYLFTDRITIALALIYGVCSSIASYCGTSAVHALQEKFNTRQSYITGVVCVGVLGSVVLSVYKLLTIGMPAH